MTKRLITAALLGGFASFSLAQSTVSIYGRIDLNVTYQDSGGAASASPGGAEGKSVVKSNDGGVNGVGGSRWGLRGSEALGPHARAYFVLESGFNADSGLGGDSLFNRQAYAALGSERFGDVRLGRQQTLTREMHVDFLDVTSEAELAITDTVAPGRPLFQNFGLRVNNAVQYLSPSLGGVRVRALIAAGEGQAARQQGAGLTYEFGQFKLGMTHEAYSDGPAASGSFNKVTTVGARYDAGFASLIGGYQNTEGLGSAIAGPLEDGSVDHDAFNLAILIPLGTLEFRGQYTKSTVDTPAGHLDQSKYGVSLRYNLSKRTQLYAAATSRRGDDDESFERKSEYVVGVGHDF